MTDYQTIGELVAAGVLGVALGSFFGSRRIRTSLYNLIESINIKREARKYAKTIINFVAELERQGFVVCDISEEEAKDFIRKMDREIAKRNLEGMATYEHQDNETGVNIRIVDMDGGYTEERFRGLIGDINLEEGGEGK